MPKLKSPNQEAFAQHYALHGSQADAYRQGYNTERMKPESIYASAGRLVKDAKVALRISELQALAAKRADEQFSIDADWMLKRLQDIDELDVIDILDDAGNVLPIRQWPKVWRTSISGLDLNEIINNDITTIVRKLKLPDKHKNLEMIGKHVSVQAFNERLEISAGKSLAELVDEVRGES